MFNLSKKVLFYLNRLREQLWFKPLIYCFISVGIVFIAQLADASSMEEFVPEIKQNSIEELLSIIASSMLVISTFAVGAMISAYSVASTTTTPRSFKLIVADDVSQNALSVYIGSFIYSVVAITALKNGFYGKVGLFVLFIITLLIFAGVILTFISWVNKISKLGRMQPTIQKIERATSSGISARYKEDYINYFPSDFDESKHIPIYHHKIGYIQLIHNSEIQKVAKDNDLKIYVNVLPGKFIDSTFPLVYTNKEVSAELEKKIFESFNIGESRIFDEDPRFGFITLSEVASRALSPGINDPGTAIAIIATYTKLFKQIEQEKEKAASNEPSCNKLFVKRLCIIDILEDAFRPIARDGAGIIEVQIRLQKTLVAIHQFGDEETKKAVIELSKTAFEYSKEKLDNENQVKLLEDIIDKLK